MKVQCIDYRDLPGQNSLFLDYLYHPDQMESLYPNPAHLSLDHLKARVDSVRKSYAFPRDRLVRLLTEFNSRLNAGDEALGNIKKLSSSDTVAVVTGHQVGLFGGPAYAIYKALTAVRLSQILEKEGYSSVPVFWLASDDSDFEEVSSTSFLDQQGEVFSVAYPGTRQNSQMAGTVSLESIEGCLKSLQETGVGGEVGRQNLAALRDAYLPVRSFREGLGAWLSKLFAPHGLILFDALSPGYKSPTGSLFEVAISERAEIVRALQDRSKALEKRGFVPQVRVQDTESLIFWTQGRDRFKLEFKDGKYAGRGESSLEFDPQKLLDELNREADSFSPNVLLRPILQDLLLPTAVYVGGPSEIAYYSQVNAIGSFWDMEMSIFPRVGMTIVDRKSQRLLTKYGAKVPDVWAQTPEAIAQGIFRGTDSGDLLQKFEDLENHLKSELESLHSGIGKLDPTAAQMLRGAEAKILYQLAKTRNRFLANRQSRQSDVGRHLRYFCSRVYPRGRLQERLINFNQFLAEEGPAFLNQLLEITNPFCPSHQVIYL